MLPAPSPPRFRTCGRVLSWWCLIGCLWFAALGCKQRLPKVPGETDLEVAAVEILPMKEGTELALEHDALVERLGLREDSLLITGRRYNPYREAEDRRRIIAFWQQRGYFDVEVSQPETTFDKEKEGAATVKWRVKENDRYKVGDVVLKQADGPIRDLLLPFVTVKTGDTEVDLELIRKARIDMQEFLRKRGYGHANVYSRFYVDREKKIIHVYYFPDAGPETVIASVSVDGAVRIPAADVLARAGLTIGARYTEDLRDRVARDLLDTGAYASAFVRVDTDTKFIVPGTQPDSGGELRDEQVDAEGNLIPRDLPPGVNLVIHVVEAPSINVKLKAGFEIDPARADTYLDTTLWFRNLFGPLDHLVIEGRVGYGLVFEDASFEHPGLYGEGLIRTVHAGALGRTVDLRTTIRYQGDLYPTAFLHRTTTGPGLRTTFLRNLFFDVDLLGFFESTERFGPFTAEEQSTYGLPRDAGTLVAGEPAPEAEMTQAAGIELDSSLVFDNRDDPVEPMSGAFVAVRSRINPFDLEAPLDHPFVNLGADVRGFIKLTPALAIGLRASGDWSLLNEGAGPPLSARLFGGGAYGFRGLGTQRLSPEILRCYEDYCKGIPVGGRSLVEGSVELRFLPPLKQFGAVVFADLGGASFDANPFATGPSFAAGLGGRLRIWYLPIALDFAWRVLENGEIQDLEDVPFHVFFRIGESF
ncbi:MAG: BamA/TamA family outer membrane protein [Polyangiaceae bacterium]